MEITYRREPNISRMIVSGVGEDIFHEGRMIEENKIEALLVFSKSNSRKGREMWFDISGRKSLKNYFAQEGINPGSIYEAIKSIKEGIEEINKYLISPGSLMLTPETVFLKREGLRWKAAFAYIPGGGEDFSLGLVSLFEYLIRNVDHNNASAVSVCYSLFEKVNTKDVTLFEILEDIEPLLTKEEKKEEVFLPVSKEIEQVSVMEEIIERPPWYDEEEIFEKPVKKKGILGFGFLGEKKPKDKTKKKKKKRDDDFWEATPADYMLESIPESNMETFGGTTLLSSEVILGRRLVYEGRGRHPDMQIDKTPYLIGSNKEGCDGIISESVISRAHARIIKIDEEYYIEDLESKNGTFLNGQILGFNKQEKLSLGDAISFANIGYRFM